MDKSVFLSQDPKENLWQLHQQQEAQAGQLQQLQEDLATLTDAWTRGATFTNADDLPHPYGLCRDPGCESCVADAQEIAVASRRTAFDDIDKWLMAAGDGKEDIQVRFAQVVQVGKAKLEQLAKVK